MSGSGVRKLEIYLRQGHTFSVPVTVAEHLLGLSSHDQLKVLLYVLCNADRPLSAEQIAQSCKVQPDAVEEALAFWQDANVLTAAPELPAVSLSAAPVQPAEQPRPAAAPVKPVSVAPQPQPQVREVARIQISSSNFALMPSEIAERIQCSSDLAELFRSAERLIRRPLNHTEQKSLIWMQEYLGIKADLLVMLVAYCADQFVSQKAERIAIEWQEQGITTHQLVEADLQRRTEARSFTGRMMRIFQMDKTPTANQQAFFDRWQQAGYNEELIRFALEVCRDRKSDKVSFPYIDKILMNLAAEGVTDIEGAKQSQIRFQQRKSGRLAEKPLKQKHSEDSSIDLEDLNKLMHPF